MTFLPYFCPCTLPYFPPHLPPHFPPHLPPHTLFHTQLAEVRFENIFGILLLFFSLSHKYSANIYIKSTKLYIFIVTYIFFYEHLYIFCCSNLVARCVRRFSHFQGLRWWKTRRCLGSYFNRKKLSRFFFLKKKLLNWAIIFELWK